MAFTCIYMHTHVNMDPPGLIWPMTENPQTGKT